MDAPRDGSIASHHNPTSRRIIKGARVQLPDETSVQPLIGPVRPRDGRPRPSSPPRPPPASRGEVVTKATLARPSSGVFEPFVHL